jgi:hypothetical protein
MPDFTFTSEQAGSGSEVDVLATWRYRKLPYPARVTILINSELAGATMQLMSGAQEIVQRGAPLTVAPAAQRLPVPQEAPVFQFDAPKDDEVTCPVTVASAITPFVNVWANIEPLG